MRFGIVGTVSFLILAMLLPGLAGGAVPSDYDECILELIKDVNGAQALALALPSIENVCRDKTGHKSKALSNEEMRQLQGKAKAHYCSSEDFSGEIYNGNSNVTVSEIVFEITATIDERKVTRLYRKDVTIKPQTAVPVYFRALECDKSIKITSWGLNSAKGY
ncbi:MAG: hypothetical protein OXI53_03115 [Nitrospira sp.]|nr:hypothetical protein [Nitrospira sp.]MDE0506699.1 hypothetical protein [Candidatus Poribacteria bacterium]